MMSWYVFDVRSLSTGLTVVLKESDPPPVEGLERLGPVLEMKSELMISSSALSSKASNRRGNIEFELLRLPELLTVKLLEAADEILAFGKQVHKQSGKRARNCSQAFGCMI